MTDYDNATLRRKPPLLETKRDAGGRGPWRLAAPAVLRPKRPTAAPGAFLMMDAVIRCRRRELAAD
jgi:hypothetical protein